MSESDDAGATPWIRGPIALDRALLDEVEAHLVGCYPSEGCGFLFGPASEPARVDAFRPEPNEADRYHALDPETFPRTSRTYFKINELRAGRALERGAAEGRPLKVIVHSHCDAGAYFSEEDAATFAHDGALMWPCAFLVVSVRDGRPVDRRLWVHAAGTDGFREAPLRIG